MPSIFSLIDAIDSDRVRSWQFYEDRHCLMTIEGKKEGRKGRRLICASIGFFIYKIILIFTASDFTYEIWEKYISIIDSSSMDLYIHRIMYKNISF